MSDNKTESCVNAPLILTLQLDDAAQAFYETLRQHYFPAQRNFIPAHLTLFHQLADEEQTIQALSEAASVTPRFDLAGGAAHSLGRGVAIFFESEPLFALHKELSSIFGNNLIAQDKQRFRPHIVIQNKVDGQTAKHTLSEMIETNFVIPRAMGLSLWRYLGGPWQHLGDFPFSDTL